MLCYFDTEIELIGNFFSNFKFEPVSDFDELWKRVEDLEHTIYINKETKYSFIINRMIHYYN